MNQMKRNRRWIRLDVDYGDSTWLARLPGDVRRLWPDFLCHVKANGTAGRSRGLAAPVLARKLDTTAENAATLLLAATNDGAVVILPSGDFEVTNWGEYQDPTGKNAERQRRFKAKQKEARELHVIEGGDFQRSA